MHYVYVVFYDVTIILMYLCDCYHDSMKKCEQSKFPALDNKIEIKKVVYNVYEHISRKYHTGIYCTDKIYDVTLRTNLSKEIYTSI